MARGPSTRRHPNTHRKPSYRFCDQFRLAARACIGRRTHINSYVEICFGRGRSWTQTVVTDADGNADFGRASLFFPLDRWHDLLWADACPNPYEHLEFDFLARAIVPLGHEFAAPMHEFAAPSTRHRRCSEGRVPPLFLTVTQGGGQVVVELVLGTDVGPDPARRAGGPTSQNCRRVVS